MEHPQGSSWRSRSRTPRAAIGVLASALLLAGCSAIDSPAGSGAAPVAASRSPSPIATPAATPVGTPVESLPQPLGPGEAAELAVAFVAAQRDVDPASLRVFNAAYRSDVEARWWVAKIGPANAAWMDGALVDLLTGRVFDPHAPSPPIDPFPRKTSPPADTRRVAPGVFAWLDLVDAFETVTVLVDETDDPAGVAAAATALGLTRDADRPEELGFAGGPQAVRAFLGDDRIRHAWVSEDRDPFRPLAAPWPEAKPFPSPGRPYLGGLGAIPVRWIGQPLASGDKAEITAAVAAGVWTFDGRPYGDASLTVTCADQGHCEARFAGSFLPAPELPRGDGWSFDAVGPGPWIVTLTSGGGGAVPRPVEREAERIARQEPEVVERLADASWLLGARWSPETPGVITVAYRLPQGAGTGTTPFARTAETEFTTLEVVVHLERRTVLRIVRDGRLEWPRATG